MKLRKDSWHYRNYERWRGFSRSKKARQQPNLCMYSRVVVYGGILRWLDWALDPNMEKNNWIQRLPGYFSLYIGAILAFTAILFPMRMLLPGDDPVGWQEALVQCIFLNTVAVTGLIVLGALFVGGLFVFFWAKEKFEEGRVDKGPPLAITKLKNAKRRTVCPLIEFTEEDLPIKS